MARDYSTVPDDELEKLVRRHVTPDLIEYLKRRTATRESALGSSTSATVTYRLGAIDGRNALIEDLDRLLTEATDPEYQR